MRRFVQVVMAIVLGITGLSAASVSASAVVEPLAAESQFLSLVNEVRAGKGLPVLARDPGLDAVARDWSGHMAATFARTGVVIRPGVKEHTVAPNCDLDALCHRPNLAEAVAAVEPDWRSAGENVGTGGEVVSLHNAFVASAGHYANIIGTYNRVGVGVVVADGTIWVTFNFLDGPALKPALNGAQRVGGTAPGTAAPLGPVARFVPVSPRRALDTRGRGQVVPAGGTVTVDLGSVADRPAGTTAAALNVTATDPAADGFLTVFPCGRARPLASSLNYEAGQTVPNNVHVALGDGGSICVYALTATHVVVDVDGWYSTADGGAAGLVTTSPRRLVDTRTIGGRRQDLTVPLGCRRAGRRHRRGRERHRHRPPVRRLRDGVPVRVGGAAGVQPERRRRPDRAQPGGREGGVDRSICVHASVPTNLIVDLAGWFAADGRPVATVSPTRLLDTRDGTGGWLNALAAGQAIDLDVAGAAGIPAGAKATLLNVTVTGGAGAGYLTVYPCGTERPLASNLNFSAGQTVANAVVAPLGGGKACFYASSPVHVIADVAGYTA